MTDSHGSPPDDEPKTPMWLPALGAALFVGVALWWAVTPSTLPIAPAEDAPSASASVAAAPPAAPPHPQAAQQVAMPMGAARPAASGLKMDPRIEERMRKLHEAGRHP